MKKTYFLIFLVLMLQPVLNLKAADQYTIDLARAFAKDIFELNGVPYLQPVVEAVNATSNSRFYNKAFIPKKNQFYFRVGLEAMAGFVPESKKNYTPMLPSEQLTTENILKYGTIDLSDPNNITYEITDTAGLLHAAFKGMMYDGILNGSIDVPESAPTALGNEKVSFDLPSDTLIMLLQNLTVDVPILGKIKLYDYLPDETKAELDSIIGSFPALFELPEGSNLNTLFAAVPQFEFGSFYGTELLIRFIPKVDMGETVGRFAFWGFGLKHSISQYFNKGDEAKDRLFDLAVQAVYQGTSLENEIGVTNAELTASAAIWDFNLHASKRFENILDVYTGLSYEMIEIESEYLYYLPATIQWELDMLESNHFEPSVGEDGTVYPGDQNPQKAVITLDDTNIKWTPGVSKEIGPLSIAVDYSFSKFHIFSAGLEYKFDFKKK